MDRGVHVGSSLPWTTPAIVRSDARATSLLYARLTWMSKISPSAFALFFLCLAGCASTSNAGSFVTDIKIDAQGRTTIERCTLEVKQSQVWLVFVAYDNVAIEKKACKKETIER
jgi:hypothetical protein